jgi:hypothetical protein
MQIDEAGSEPCAVCRDVLARWASDAAHFADATVGDADVCGAWCFARPVDDRCAFDEEIEHGVFLE